VQDGGVEVVRYVADGWGIGEVWLEDGVVLASELPRPGSDPGETERTGHPLAQRLAAWFSGAPDPLDDVPLALPEGTPFQDALAAALRTVPRGEVVTYGELAALAGRPRAPRAAGTFCAACDLCPFLPVHRVVGATGLGGFGSLGLDYKRRLLALEGVAL
jgi:methylated-DNA-[protein]-cysteine S-methyltransferase